MNNLMFLYGSLKVGKELHFFDERDDVTYIGEFVSENKFHMIDLGSYPALIMPPPGKPRFAIMGELWLVSDEVFEILDHIEGYPHFYDRQQINTPHGPAWVYYLDQPIRMRSQSGRVKQKGNTQVWI